MGGNMHLPTFHPKFPSDDELLHYLNYIPLYISFIDSFTETQQNFCEYLEKCNDLILPQLASIIHDYVAEQKQIGWITNWAADILVPLIRENKIKICTDPNSVRPYQLKLKRIGSEWPSELEKYCYFCDYDQFKDFVTICDGDSEEKDEEEESEDEENINEDMSEHEVEEEESEDDGDNGESDDESDGEDDEDEYEESESEEEIPGEPSARRRKLGIRKSTDYLNTIITLNHW